MHGLTHTHTHARTHTRTHARTHALTHTKKQRNKRWQLLRENGKMEGGGQRSEEQQHVDIMNVLLRTVMKKAKRGYMCVSSAYIYIHLQINAIAFPTV